jgi:lysozyme
MSKIDEYLAEHEGVRLKPYFDCCGKPYRECTCKTKGNLTVCTGRNLDDVPFSMAENDLLRENDKQRALIACMQAFPWFKRLNGPRQDVVQMMAFNMGIDRLKGFHNALEAMAAGVFDVAAQEMLRSKWARQVGDGPGGREDRAEVLAEIMRTGAYPQKKASRG